MEGSMDDKQGSDSFDEEVNRNVQVDELAAVENFPFSEITESGQGLIDLPQAGVSLSSEDTRSGEYEPSQVSDIGQSEKVSERRDMVPDSSLEGRLSVEPKSSEQLVAISETLQAETVGESKCPIASGPPSENIETDNGASAAPQSGIVLPSEGIKPSQLAGSPSYLGRLSRQEVSARKEMLDFGSPGPSSIATISAKQKGAIPKSRKGKIAGKSKITTPQKIEAIDRDMRKLKIDDSTGNKLPGEHPSSSKQSNTSRCNEEIKDPSQVRAVQGLDYFSSFIKLVAENEYAYSDYCVQYARSLIKSHSKSIAKATKLNMSVKIKILKTFLIGAIEWYEERVRHLLNLTTSTRYYSSMQADSMIHSNNIFLSLLTIKPILRECCDCCISDKVEMFDAFMNRSDSLLLAINRAQQVLDGFASVGTFLEGEAILKKSIATYASHWEEPNSPLRVHETTAEASSASDEDPRVPVVECFTSPEVSPSKDNEQSGRSRVREGAAKDRKRNKKGWRKK